MNLADISSFFEQINVSQVLIYNIKQVSVIDGHWGRPVCTLGIGRDQFIQTVTLYLRYILDV